MPSISSHPCSFLDEPLADFRNRKTQALLIYLLVEATLAGRRREHQREQLMELPWPGLPQQSAQVNLRQTLYQLRQLVPQVSALRPLLLWAGWLLCVAVGRVQVRLVRGERRRAFFAIVFGALVGAPLAVLNAFANAWV